MSDADERRRAWSLTQFRARALLEIGASRISSALIPRGLRTEPTVDDVDFSADPTDTDETALRDEFVRLLDVVTKIAIGSGPRARAPMEMDDVIGKRNDAIDRLATLCRQKIDPVNDQAQAWLDGHERGIAALAVYAEALPRPQRNRTHEAAVDELRPRPSKYDDSALRMAIASWPYEFDHDARESLGLAVTEPIDWSFEDADFV